MSQPRRPKQLLRLFNNESMIAASIRRISPLVSPEDILVITGADIEEEVRQELPNLPPENIIGEPRGRNTAPCVALGALISRARFGEDRILAVLPADHHIAKEPAFLETFKAAVQVSKQGHVATIGIQPTHPETGYGYLHCGDALDDTQQSFKLKRFVEKPSLETALGYLEDGNYLWNSGTFFFPTKLILEEFEKHLPDVLAQFDSESMAGSHDALKAEITKAYEEMPSISIDYGIMEKCDKIAAIRGDFGWSDVGSWRALLDHRDAGSGNFKRGLVVEEDCENSVLVADEGKIVAALGIENLAVVSSGDATLVLPLERAQEVRGLMEKVRSMKKNQA